MFTGNGHVVLNAEYINTFRKLAAFQTLVHPTVFAHYRVVYIRTSDNNIPPPHPDRYDFFRSLQVSLLPYPTPRILSPGSISNI